MTDETRERIKDLERQAKEAQARSNELTAEADRLRGDILSAEFHAALAACYRNEPGSEERKDRAYVRLQAPRCMDGDFSFIDEKDRPVVAAEVERLRKESPGTAGQADNSPEAS